MEDRTTIQPCEGESGLSRDEKSGIIVFYLAEVIAGMDAAEIPKPDEIEVQLARMLNSRLFIANENPAKFLKLVVTKALAGEEIRQSIVGEALFPARYAKEDISDVRVTARNLRTITAEYYANEGQNDPVRIELPTPPPKSPKLPPGKAYTPLFSYNPHRAATKDFKIGEFYRSRGNYGNWQRAFRSYLKVLKESPHHVGAAIGAAEALCELQYHETAFMRAQVRKEAYDMAVSLLNQTYLHAPSFWRLYAAGGAMMFMYGSKTEAARLFAKAFALDRSSTESYGWYFIFLVESGRSNEGVQLSAKHLDANVGDLTAHLTHARVLLRARRYAELETILEGMLEMDKNCCDVHHLLAGLRDSQDRREEAEYHYKQVELLGDADTFDNFKREYKLRQAKKAELALARKTGKKMNDPFG